MSIKLHLTHTQKRIGSKDGYHISHEQNEYFETVELAMEWIKREYGGKTRTYQYKDRRDGTALRCGYVFSWRDYEFEDGKRAYYWYQTWISFSTVEVLEI